MNPPSMELAPLDGLAIAGYFALLSLFGYLTRRNRTFQEFAVGKHSVPMLMVFASLAATIVGPGFSFGFTAQGYVSGYLFYILCLTYPLQTIATGLFLAPRLTRHRDCATLGDVMRKQYGPAAQILTGLISVLVLAGFTAVMGRIGGGMLQAITGWPLGVCLLIVTGSTALLTFAGGLRATIATEALQFSLFSLVVPAMLLVAVFNGPVDFAQHSDTAWELTKSGIASMPRIELLSVAVSFLLGEVLLPPYANRALAAESKEASTAGFVLAGGYTVVWLGIVAILGVVAHTYIPAGVAAENVFLAMGHRLLPVGVYGILLAAVVAIVMSSQESVLNSAAVSFVRDVVNPRGQLSDASALVAVKVSTLGIAALAIYFAQFAPSIIDGLMILYALWAPAMLLPLLGALFDIRASRASGLLSMAFGASTSLIWTLVLHVPAGIPAILVGLAGSAIGFICGWVLAPQPGRRGGKVEVSA